MRSLPGPVFFPLRALAIALHGLLPRRPDDPGDLHPGVRGARRSLQGVPTTPFFWAVVALVLVYSAYVAEVYRAGIDSVHPSQVAAARSLGLSRWQSLRFVVLPAGRAARDPAAAERLHRPAEGHGARVASIGVDRGVPPGQIDSAATFNFTPYLVAALLFVLITIPLARFTDWLIARQRRKRQGGTAA